MLPGLNALRVFESVARHQNFRLAAEELHLTQSAVAQRVRRLESDLGTILFTRQPRGLLLTAQGQTYHQSVQAGLAVIDEATRALTAKTQHLVMSVPPSFGSKWLLPRMDEIREAFPDIELRITVSEALAGFGADGVDFVIRFSSPPFDKGLHVECMAAAELCAVASPSYAAANPVVRGLSDLSRHRLIDDAHRNWEKLIRHANLGVADKVLRFEQTSLAIDAALAGQGLCIAPRILVEAHIANDELRVLHEIEKPDDEGYFLLYPEGRDFDPGKWAIIDWLKGKMAGSLPWNRVRP
ncbi:LysR substrate-binding domain-containing protein [Marinobacter sp.]|uniref:LysR substrate-binding domain-containing protein n=1 Tax=Marinobacter sp. TaxID=50741 RepID=UPI003B524E80